MQYQSAFEFVGTELFLFGITFPRPITGTSVSAECTQEVPNMMVSAGIAFHLIINMQEPTLNQIIRHTSSHLDGTGPHRASKSGIIRVIIDGILHRLEFCMIPYL